MINKLRLLPTLLLLCTNTFSQNYSIAKWLNDKKACVVLTYDDWLEGHGGIVLDQLIQRDMVASFYINSDWSGRSGGYDTMMYAVNHGMEIGNHTMSHPDLVTITTDSVKKSINGCFDSINHNVTNQQCLTFAYPFGSYNNSIINEVRKKHIAARAVWGKWFWNYKWTYDIQWYYYELATMEVSTTTATLNLYYEIRDAIVENGLLTLMMHEIFNNNYGSSTGYDAMSDVYHASLLDYIKTYDDKIWVPTLANAVKYHKERRCATLNTISDNGSEWKLNLQDTLSDNTIYDQALTIQLKVSPTFWATSITQNGNAINNYILKNDTLSFNAIPDGGEIVINYDHSAAVVESELSTSIKQIYPNITSDKINVIVQPNGTENYSVVFYNELGQQVFLEKFSAQGFNLQTMDVSQLQAGRYFMIVSSENARTTKFVQVQ